MVDKASWTIAILNIWEDINSTLKCKLKLQGIISTAR